MDIECPYCGKELEINHDDGFGYEEGVNHEMECGGCEKNFVFETSISFYYEARKADCLNGKEHKLRLSSTCPNVFSNMMCCDCDYRRDLTEDERIKYDIGTKQSYFDNLKLCK